MKHFTFKYQYDTGVYLDDQFRAFFINQIKPQLSVDDVEPQHVRIHLLFDYDLRMRPVLSGIHMDPFKVVSIRYSTNALRCIMPSTNYADLVFAGPYSLSALM